MSSRGRHAGRRLQRRRAEVHKEDAPHASCKVGVRGSNCSLARCESSCASGGVGVTFFLSLTLDFFSFSKQFASFSRFLVRVQLGFRDKAGSSEGFVAVRVGLRTEGRDFVSRC